MTASSWSSILDCTQTGPRSTLSNAVAVLQRDPQWSSDVLWYDEFLDRILLANSPIREWRDDDDTRLTVYLQESVRMVTMSERTTFSAVQYVARQRAKHCVRDWFSTLIWDDVPRIAHAFEDYWGAESTERQPSDYLRAVSANFFLGIVARVMHPGCQLDNMLVFEGPQGIGKSRALRLLGGDWYMLAAESVTHKDFFQAFPGKLIVEIGEMDSFSRAERERVKLAISTPTDRYRVSFGRRAEDHPRQCVFAGTTNRDDWLADETGGRRFWPVSCGLIAYDALGAARAQLFAEAYRRVQAGESWWQTPNTATLAVQRDRQAEDVWTARVLDWLMGKSEATSAEILSGALKMRDADMTRTEQLRIGSILRLAGWKRQTIRRDGQPIKAWTAPVTDDDGVVTFT
jgi:putative DNA primase/helicase